MFADRKLNFTVNPTKKPQKGLHARFQEVCTSGRLKIYKLLWAFLFEMVVTMTECPLKGGVLNLVDVYRLLLQLICVIKGVEMILRRF